MQQHTPPPTPIRVGVSSCLLGEPVRYDGGHKHNSYITRTLGQFFTFQPVCPEVAIGLTTPRPPIRLVHAKTDSLNATEHPVRAVGIKDPTVDVTEALTAFGQRMADTLTHLSGYIFKRASPSCGMERVKVYHPDQDLPPDATGRGLYARALMRALPLLPTEEEGRLCDPVLRENFIERVFIYHRWQQLTREGLTPAALVGFHAEHKYIIMSRGDAGYRALGQRVAGAGKANLQALGDEYIARLMELLKRPATRKRHSNVLMHLMGYLKKHLAPGDKLELLALIDEYRRGHLPLVVPMTLLKHHLRRHPNAYLARQHYLSPHPEALMLRNLL